MSPSAARHSRPFYRRPALRRWVAALFLVLVAFYLGAPEADRHGGCPDEQGQICHLLCEDGCATAPLPVPPSPPPPDPMPGPVYAMALMRPVLAFALEPEVGPPRV